MSRSGSVVSVNSVTVSIVHPESAGIQENGGKHKGRKVSFMSGVAVKAKKFFSAAGAKIKNIFSGHGAKPAAGQVPQREKPVISAPFNVTHIVGAGISAHECRNPFLTEPVQTVAVELIREPSIDPQRVAELVADNPLVKKASSALAEESEDIFGAASKRMFFVPHEHDSEEIFGSAAEQLFASVEDKMQKHSPALSVREAYNAKMKLALSKARAEREPAREAERQKKYAPLAQLIEVQAKQIEADAEYDAWVKKIAARI